MIIHIQLLGAIDARDARGAAIAGIVNQPKRAALLAYLATALPHGSHRRDTVLALFWPELDETRARKALNQSIHHLRSQLGEDIIYSEGRDQIGIVTGRIWCDVVEFEAALDRGDIDAATALYRGDFLEGFHVSDLVELERWIEATRERLRKRAAEARWAMAARATEESNFTAAIGWARGAYGLSPEYDEPAFRRLLIALDQNGDRGGALQEYDALTAALRAEFDAEPAPETTSLVEQIRARSETHHVPQLNKPAARTQSAVAPEELAREVPPIVAKRKLWLMAPLLALLLFGAVWGAREAWHRLRPVAVQSGGVAVFPFAFSGAPASSHLADGVAGLMAANLAGFGAVHSIDSRAVATAAADGGSALTQRRAARIAADLGARMYVLGTVSQAGARLRLTAVLYEAERFGITVDATVEGAEDDLFALTDQLTARLLAGRLSPGERVRFASAERMTTSPQALQAFTEGEAAFRSGRFGTALDAYRRAVELDTTFALAYLRLSNAAHWTGENVLAESAAGNALQLSGRLGARDRTRVRAWELYITGALDDAERAYYSLLAQDSADTDAWLQLGEIGFHAGPLLGRSTLASRVAWERILELSPYNVVGLLHLARIEAAAGRQREFDDVVRRLEALKVGPESSAELELLRAFAFGDAAAQTIAVARVGRLRVTLRREMIRHAAFVARDLRAVRAQLPALILEPYTFDNREAGEMALAAGYDLASGRIRNATATLDSAARIEPARIAEFRAAMAAVPVVGSLADKRALRDVMAQPVTGRGADWYATVPRRLYLEGLLALQQGDTAGGSRAIAALQEYARTTTNERSVQPARYGQMLLEAERLRAIGQPGRALEHLGPPQVQPRGVPSTWGQARAHERFLRGELLAILGRRNEALAWFETFPDPAAYDFLYLPAALLWQLRLQNELQRPAAAAQISRRIAELLAGADPHLRKPPEQLLPLLPGR